MHSNNKKLIKSNLSRVSQSSKNKLAKLHAPLTESALSPYLDNHDLARLSTSCVTLYTQTDKIRQKRALLQLLQAMLHDEPLIVSHILKSYPEFLFAKPENYRITEIESQYTWLRYLITGESVFSIAQKLGLVDMVKIMIPYFIKEIKKEKMCNEDHPSEPEKQWFMPSPSSNLEEEYKRQEEQHVLREKYIQKYLSAPIKALESDSTIQVYWKENPENKCFEAKIDNASDNTIKAFELLREEIFKPKAINDCIDTHQLLRAAYEGWYDVKDRFNIPFLTIHQRDAYAILMIGFIESLVEPKLGQILCKHFNKCLIGPNSVEPLKLKDGRSFYRLDRDSHSGLGFNFFCSLQYFEFAGAGWNQGARAWEPYVVYKFFHNKNAECCELTQRVLRQMATKHSRCAIS